MHEQATNDCDDVADVTDETLLDWAREFIRKLAAGRRPRLRSLGHLPDDRQAALAQVVPEALRDRRSPVRRAAAWVAGALDILSDETVPLLRDLLRDRVAPVRMAAAWACGDVGEDAEEAVPDLVAALRDPNDGVRFATAWSLGQLGGAAASAVEVLIDALSTDVTKRVRDAAAKALAEIAPADPRVQAALSPEAENPVGNRSFFAACGFARARSADAPAKSRLLANMTSLDSDVATASVWAVGRIPIDADEAVPRLLEAMDRWEWLGVDYPDKPLRELVSLRPVLREALENRLPETEDGAYGDFRLRFLTGLFHPRSRTDLAWIEPVVGDEWYRELQRNWLRRIFKLGRGRRGSARLDDLMTSAPSLFAARLIRSHGLGLVPGRYAELPGYVRNYAAKVAVELLKAEARHLRYDGGLAAGILSVASDDAAYAHIETIEIADAVRRFIVEELPFEVGAVVERHLLLGESIPRVGAALGLSASEVKTRYKHGLAALRRRFGHLAD